jgi:hypothetical protein
MGTEGEYMDGFTMMKSVKRHVLPNWFALKTDLDIALYLNFWCTVLKLLAWK